MIWIKIREIREEDLETVHKIERNSFRYPYPYSYLHFLFTLSRKLFLVAEIYPLQKIVGYIVGVIQYKNVGHIYSIAVDERYRGRGIGKKLIKKLLEKFIEKKCKTIRLEVRPSNIAAQNLYDKIGFRKNYLVKKYYPDGEDCCTEILEMDEENECD